MITAWNHCIQILSVLDRVWPFQSNSRSVKKFLTIGTISGYTNPKWREQWVGVTGLSPTSIGNDREFFSNHRESFSIDGEPPRIFLDRPRNFLEQPHTIWGDWKLVYQLTMRQTCANMVELSQGVAPSRQCQCELVKPSVLVTLGMHIGTITIVTTWWSWDMTFDIWGQ